MIISCPNCNKKFNLDENLIPEKGRLLQCSNCKNKWHYIIPKKDIEINQNEIANDKKNIAVNFSLRETEKKKKRKTITNDTYDQANKFNQLKNTKKKNISKKYSLTDILNNLIIVFITFIALILILDTFKRDISNYFPIIIPLLDDLYQSISDLSFFVIDLLK